MESILLDLRFALRMLARRPAFTLLAVLSLGLGIGANTTIFSLVDALLLRSLPVEAPDRLLTFYTREGANPGSLPLSHLNFLDFREQAKSYSGVAGYDWVPLAVALGGGESERTMGQMVSPGYFDVLGVAAAVGRTFSAEEEAPGGAPVVVVSQKFFRDRLGGEAGALGKPITLNGSAYSVIGVMPGGFTGTDVLVAPEMWIPMAQNRQIRLDPAANWYETRRPLFVATFARLKDGITVKAATAEAEAIAARLARDFPDDNRSRTLRVIPLPQASMNPEFRQMVVAASGLLLAVVGLVLLVACANVANLLLARAFARRREIAVRLSQGAGRWRLARQLLTESVLLSLLGAAVGLALAAGAIRVVESLLPSLPMPITVAIDLRLDPRVLAFTLGVAVATGLLFGLAPAWQATRPELVSALKNQAGPGAGRRRFGLRGALVAAQVALSVVALIAAGLFLKSLGKAREIDPGFDAPRLAAITFDLSLQGLDPARGEQVMRDLLERARTLPGVSGAGLTTTGPFAPALRMMVLPAERRGEIESSVLLQTSSVDPGYFKTMGIPLLAGRAFGPDDRDGTAPVVVVNRTLAERFWPGQPAAAAVGRRLASLDERPDATIVGVVRDTLYNNPGEEPQPFLYLPLAQTYGPSVTLVARTEESPAALLPTLARGVREVVRGMPLSNVSTVSRLLDNVLWAPRIGAGFLALFGALALVLAGIGLYGVLSTAVAQRSREIGIRMAVGSPREKVLALVVRQGLLWVGAGLVLGLLAAGWLSRYTGGLLIGVSPTDPWVFGGVALVLLAVALVSTLAPARRAMAVDPLVALRAE